MKNPAIDFDAFRFLPGSRNVDRPESLWLCDNLRCGAPVGAGWPTLTATTPDHDGRILLCEECIDRARRGGRTPTYTISEAV